MLRSATTNDQAATLLRGFIEREIVETVAREIGGEDARLRASLMGSQMVGLAMARYVVGLEPLASATRDEVVAAFAPALQALVT